MTYKVEVVAEVTINKKSYKIGENLSVSQSTYDLYKNNFKIQKQNLNKKEKAVEEK